jgi:hypothetical protein
VFVQREPRPKRRTRLKKRDNSSQFLVYTKKYIKKKNIDDARVTQDEVIVKHGLKKWQHFNLS